MNYDSPREIIATLREQSIGPKKRWGQNFLIDGNVRRAIAALAQRGSAELLWEVGPGLGALTQLLLGGGPVVAFEIDWGIIRYLEQNFAGTGLTVIAGDAVETIPRLIESTGPPDVVVGNLPYSSASAILSVLIESPSPPRRIVATVQKEMADRLVAPVGNKQYSAFTVAVRAIFEVKRAFDIRPACFYPAPEVVSTVVTLTRREQNLGASDPGLFRAVKDALFAGRRKTVLNNLRSRTDLGVTGAQNARELLLRADIDPDVRAEQLEIEGFVRLSNELARQRSEPSTHRAETPPGR
jgi:16S rRNA (adenine1518-N6/adenine1519-N6)-dimethyltransferase